MVDAYKAFQKGIKIDATNSFSINYNELNGRFDYDFYSPENRKMFTKLDTGKSVRLGDICDIVKVKSKKLKDPNLSVEYVELSDIDLANTLISLPNDKILEDISAKMRKPFDLRQESRHQIESISLEFAVV